MRRFDVLDEKTRNTILTLAKKKISKRSIAKLLKISRNSVQEVIASQSSQPPTISRPEKAEPFRDEILELYGTCGGNLVRVHEELLIQGAQISYPALTAFCRRHEIGTRPKQAAGRYSFEPGQEMQHDTSPHQAEIGGKVRKIQTASAVLCYSHMLFFQGYPRFRRFECKLFLTEALCYFQGAPGEAMVDNTHVIILRGTGEDMIPTAEMEAFAERYGMVFRAHAVGDANRSGRVERPFHYIENNFLAGRTFADWDDLNQQARDWCEAKNRTFKRHLKAVPIELYNVERVQLKPLPVWVPEPYLLHQRIVDVHAYVTVDTNRYSVPEDWVGKRVQGREGKSEIVITCGRECLTHVRHPEPEHKWITLPEHRSQRRRKKGSDPPKELAILLRRAPELESYVKALRGRIKRSLGFALRQILRMLDDYPREPLLDAIRDAEHYGLYDVDRLENMVLQRIDRDFFPLGKIGEHDD
jgi:transposase